MIWNVFQYIEDDADWLNFLTYILCTSPAEKFESYLRILAKEKPILVHQVKTYNVRQITWQPNYIVNKKDINVTTYLAPKIEDVYTRFDLRTISYKKFGRKLMEIAKTAKYADRITQEMIDIAGAETFDEASSCVFDSRIDAEIAKGQQKTIARAAARRASSPDIYPCT